MKRMVIEHHLITFDSVGDEARVKWLVELQGEVVRIVITHMHSVVESIEITLTREEFEHLTGFLFHLNPLHVELLNDQDAEY